jgi:hypothetical protein
MAPGQTRGKIKVETQNRSLTFALGFSLLTALTLAGGLALALVSGNVLFESFNVHISGLASGLLVLPIFLAALFGAGAAWGFLIGRITNGETMRLAKSGALAYGVTVILVGIILELLFGAISVLDSVISLPIHIAFTIVFVPAAGMIAALCTRRLANALGREDIKGELGKYSGLAAAAGFLIVNLVMLAFGWQVGAPGAAERFTMITVMLTSNAGAALAGGAAMGWVLSGE